MCSGCGQCGGAKPTRVSEASDLEPEAALIQLAGLESGRQAGPQTVQSNLVKSNFCAKWFRAARTPRSIKQFPKTRCLDLATGRATLIIDNQRSLRLGRPHEHSSQALRAYASAVLLVTRMPSYIVRFGLTMPDNRL